MLSIGQINEGCGVNLSSDFSLPSVFLKSKGTADDKVRQFSLNSKKNESSISIDGDVVEYSFGVNCVPRLFVLDNGKDYFTVPEVTAMTEQVPLALIIFSDTTGAISAGNYAVYSSCVTYFNSETSYDDKLINAGFTHDDETGSYIISPLPSYEYVAQVDKTGNLVLEGKNYKESIGNLFIKRLNGELPDDYCGNSGNYLRYNIFPTTLEECRISEGIENDETYGYSCFSYAIGVEIDRYGAYQQNDLGYFVLSKVKNGTDNSSDSNFEELDQLFVD